MKASLMTAAIAVASVAFWWGGADRSTALDQAAPSLPPDDGIEVLTRGPVHEAFAEPVMLDQRELMVVDTAPPEPIDELPPDLRPEGENVVWIHGYWAWDEERGNFLWVSGVWRDVPPGREWMTGYWSKGEGGYYWTPGFWISAQVDEVTYLPPPPASLEAGPQVEAPSEDHIWSPGVWRWHESRYLWQPGHWVVARPDWVWVPPRYVWCPTGYVYVDGYWDYPLVSRGVLFAPVYYHRPVYRLVDYYYTPTVVINPHILTVHLFAHPRYCHYYFGDFYGPRYAEIGIVPWFSFHTRRIGYDPLFAYYSWHYGRREPSWFISVQRRHRFFAANEAFRPARTYSELRRQRVPQIHTGDVHIQNVVVQQTNLAVTLNQYAENVQRESRAEGRREGVRFARVGDSQRRGFQERARELRSVADRRGEVETAPLAEAAIEGGERRAPRTLRLGERAGRGDRRAPSERAVTGTPAPADQPARDETARQDGLRFRQGRLPAGTGVATDPAGTQAGAARSGLPRSTDEWAATREGEAARRLGAQRRLQDESGVGTRRAVQPRWAEPQARLPVEPRLHLEPRRELVQPSQPLDRQFGPGVARESQPLRQERQLPIHVTPDGQPPTAAVPDSVVSPPMRNRSQQLDRTRLAVPGDREGAVRGDVRAFHPPQTVEPGELMPTQRGGAFGAGDGAARRNSLPGRTAPEIRPGFGRAEQELRPNMRVPQAVPSGDAGMSRRVPTISQGGAVAGPNVGQLSPVAPPQPNDARANAGRNRAAGGLPHDLRGAGLRGAPSGLGAERPRTQAAPELPRRFGHGQGGSSLAPDRTSIPQAAPTERGSPPVRGRYYNRRGR